MSYFAFLVLAFGVLIPHGIHITHALQQNFLHQWCIGQFHLSEFQAVHEAIVCGESPLDSQIISDFKKCGLIHLLVVSGSHLVFLEEILTRVVGQRKWLIGIILTVYVIMTGLQPPAVRAWLGWLLNIFQKNQRLSWSRLQVTILTLVILLVAVPEWRTSDSLLMSTLASAALAFMSESRLKWSHVVSQTFIFLVMSVVILKWGGGHPASIVMNLVFGGWIGAVLFPADVIACVIHPFIFVSDFLWRYTLAAIHTLSDEIPQPSVHLELSNQMMWACALALLFLMEFTISIRRQKWATISKTRSKPC